MFLVECRRHSSTINIVMNKSYTSVVVGSGVNIQNRIIITPLGYCKACKVICHDFLVMFLIIAQKY
jgi:hypothetical protein